MSDTKDKLTHWKKLHNPDYFGAYCLQPNEEITVTIASITQEMVTGSDGKDQECTICRFKENVKPLILNKTNKKTIATVHKTPYIEHWIGKQVILFSTKVKAFGDEVEAIRIRNKVPVIKKPELFPGSEKWQTAIDSLLNETTSIEAICKYYHLSDENKEKLLFKVEQSQPTN